MTGTDVEPGTQGITVVLPTFAVERVFEEAAALLATRPGLSAVRPPGRLVSRVLQHIIMNFPNLEIEEIAQAVRVSPRHLYRVFTAELEMVTPKDFLDRVRIEAAKCLLKESSAKLDAIAQMVGFCDAPHLSRVFRRHTGQTPRMYRLN